MAAQILSFAAARLREPATRDWSRQELAEFYRVESALLQAGLALESERGLTDEGDPWFVFCRADTGEVFIHFARVDGVYVVDGAAFGSPSRGRDFAALVRDLIASHPLATARRPGSNVMIHPAALLIALVGAAFFHSTKAKAAEPGDHAAAAADASRAGERRGLLFNAGGPAPAADGGRAVTLDASEVAAVLTGVAIGLRAAAAAAAVPGGGGGSAAGPELGSEAASLRALRALAPVQASAALAGLAPHDARAALTVIAVFHDLAQTVATSAVGPSVAATGVLAAPVDIASAPAASAAAPTATGGGDPGGALLVVRLASGPMPHIEALALVQADGALTHVAADHVVHVDQLPQLLTELIAHGEVIVTAPGGGPPSGGGTPPGGGDGTGADAGGLVAQGVSDARHDAVAHDRAIPVVTPDTATPAPQDAGSPHPAPTSDAAPSGGVGVASPAPVDPTPITVAPPAAPGHDPRIDAAVLAFVTQVADVKVLISGHEVVFYDPALFSVLPAGETPDSITWRLEDGSSVSLVGTASELHAYHGVG